MACAVCGGDSPLPASVLGWRKSKRIQYHVAKFQSKDAEEVLRRYLNSLPELNVSEVQRYAIHVAAWLSTPNCAAKLQTVKLLCSYLEQLQASNADLCPCLTTGLKAIWQTRPDFVDGIDGPWARLQDVMPAEVFGTEGSNINTPWMAGNAKKAVRRLQKTIQVWRNTVGNERASYVEALEQEVQQLSFQKGSDSLLERKQLESIFRRAVAALSQPLFWSCQERGEELDQDSLEQEGAEGNLQCRLRRIVIFCLTRVDQQDAKFAAVLDYLKELLSKVDNRDSQRTALVGCKQWTHLQSKVHQREFCKTFAACAGAGDLQSGTTASHLESLKVGSFQNLASALGEAKPCSVSKQAKRKGLAQNPAEVGEGLPARCEHGRNSRYCSICSACEHDKARKLCRFCKGCPHGRLRKNCKFCVGCPHGRLKHGCRECNACPHGKARRSCNVCNGCPHGRMKADCRKCCSCPHGKLRRGCILCVPCPHGKLKSKCLECTACPHGKRKDQCRECLGCEHGKVRYNCSICNACPHGRLKKHCGVCNGCIHGRRKDKCKTCVKEKGPSWPAGES